MTDLGLAMSGGFGAGLSQHGIELAPGDGAPIDPMKRTAAPAAALTVSEAFDPIPELAEVQRLNLARTSPTHGRLSPTQPPPPAAQR
jgi:hypothetical protein